MKRFPFVSVVILIAAVILALLTIQNCDTDEGLYKWKQEDGKNTLYSGTDKVGFFAPLKADDCKIDDKISRLGEGVFRIVRKVENTLDKPLDSLRLTIDFVHLVKADWLMIPSVTYNGNEWGRGLEPKGFEKDGSWWSFSYTRTAVPGAIYSEGSRWAVALWGELGKDNFPFSCSLMPEPTQTTHRLIWPEEEMPLRYSNRDQYAPGFRGSMVLKPGESITLSAILVVTPVLPNHAAIKVFLQQAWDIIPHPRIPVQKPGEVWNLAVRFASESLWAEEGIFNGFSIGLWLRDGGWIQRPAWKYEIGWAGQNASFANSLMVDFLNNNNRQSLDMAIKALDSWAKFSPQPNGLFRTHFDYILGIEQSEEILDACNLGDAAADFISAWELAKKCGIERENYKSLALCICDFMVRDQRPSGQYGKGWTKEGICLYRDGSVGAFIIPAMIRAYKVTGNNSYLASAKRAYDFYFEDFAKKGFTTAGALDTWCIDKESSLPMLRSALNLYEETKDSSYLVKAEQTSWYISTWFWHYSIPYADSTDFRRYGYDTFGGTAVSTQHHHLDGFGLYLVADWLKLAKLTGNKIWKEKALATWANGNQCVADGKTEYHGVVRPAGSQTEAYFQTRWSGKPGYFADWLVSWMAAFRLETLRNLENWKELE